MRERLQLTEEDGLRALEDHARDKAAFARAKYGGTIGFEEMRAILEDPEVVRFQTELRFDGQLLPGEFAHLEARGDRASEGYSLFVHPSFAQRPDVLPMLIAYHLVRVNYGDMATTDAAELFGSTLLGIDREEYYAALCGFSDALA